MAVDEFMYVLVIGVVVLALAVIFFASIPNIGIVVPITSLSVGTVGFTGDNMISRSYGSFQVGEVNKEVIKGVPQIQVSSSYFGGKVEKQEVKILNAYVPLAREATITFTVYDSTPGYGNLIIKWNGQELYRNGAARGVYTLHIEKQYIKEVNNLEVSCDGPGLFFWASTVYILRDFKVNLDYGNMRLIPFTLGAEDIATFKNGALEFSSSGTAKLTVKVNGAEVFSKAPGPSESVKFDLFNSGVTPGNNMIALSAPDGTLLLSNVVLKIFLSTGQTFRERTFSISPGNYSLFLQGYVGKMQFDVAAITRQGDMGIKLNGNELNVPAIRNGINTIIFTDKEAKEGTNTLIFSGTGGWDVGEVRIFLER